MNIELLRNQILDEVMGTAPVIPVIVIDRVEDALPLARAGWVSCAMLHMSTRRQGSHEPNPSAE